ncbi:2-succinyl-5-enolpyruvyl-6-hydroxy-3-cyclohexene-1-carboxylic-acid synthase [Auritidibacter sp. NML120779]|nr:2-succinyl-5-enolpyruvyl-6-hydroxy-3-cyclohexene-1-carboxylic-acid synthase [Auritidibacter sp. NML120779]
MVSMDSMLTARTIVGTLQQAGVRHVVIGPGSRSAPMVYALAEASHLEGFKLYVRVDERAAAHTALGLSLGSGAPAAVLTTSGTAVGNLMPAVMEAAHADVALIALTADRPAELQGTGANQTTDQRNIFGVHARASVTIDSEDYDPASLRATVKAMVSLSTGTASEPAGPVHLNLRFREPLVPSPDSLAPTDFATGPLPLVHRIADEQWDPRDHDPGRALIRQHTLDVSELPEHHSVVIAGHGAGPVAAEFAHVLGLPLFAEPSSNARYGRNAVAGYPLLLGTSSGQDAHPLAEHISHAVIFGRPTLSRQIAALLKRPDVKAAMYLPRPVGWFHRSRRRETMIKELPQLARFAGQGAPGWLAAWQAASNHAQARIESALEQVAEDRHREWSALTAMRAAQVVAATARGNLVIGSSSVIRDIDIAWRPPFTPHSTIYANRGLAGIDGTLSVASGIALATDLRTVVLCGDLTFLYDSLALGSLETEPDLDIVVINDTGGAIFAGLEHGQVAQYPGMSPVVERFFGTPHRTDISALSQAFDIDYQLINNEFQLMSLLAEPTTGRRVIEVRSDRELRPSTRKAVQEAVRASFV